jgi:hypothetical protein
MHGSMNFKFKKMDILGREWRTILKSNCEWDERGWILVNL